MFGLRANVKRDIWISVNTLSIVKLLFWNILSPMYFVHYAPPVHYLQWVIIILPFSLELDTTLSWYFIIFCISLKANFYFVFLFKFNHSVFCTLFSHWNAPIQRFRKP